MTDEDTKSDLNFQEFKYYTDEEIQSRVRGKFSHRFDITLVISGLCSIILPIYNVVVIYMNFFVYRDSFRDIYNQLVTIVEFLMINLLMIFGLLRIGYYWRYSTGRRLYYFHRFLSNLQFNLFSLVSYLSLNGIYSLFSKARDRGEVQSERLIKPTAEEKTHSIGFQIVRMLATIFYLIFYANLLLWIAFSVLTKLSLVSFVGTVSIDQWTFDQIFLFIGIVNNLASLAQDNEVTLDFMWIILNDEWDPERNVWKRQKSCSFRVGNLYQMMYEVSPWKAMMWIGTMNGRELLDLIRKP